MGPLRGAGPTRGHADPLILKAGSLACGGAVDLDKDTAAFLSSDIPGARTKLALGEAVLGVGSIFDAAKAAGYAPPGRASVSGEVSGSGRRKVAPDPDVLRVMLENEGAAISFARNQRTDGCHYTLHAPLPDLHLPVGVVNASLDDGAEAEIHMLLCREFRKRPDASARAPTLTDARQAMKALARRNGFDPIRDHIEKELPAWDGQPRASSWLHRLCGVDGDAGYVAALSHWWPVAMILRGLYPGAHWPVLPILIGSGGLGKALLLKVWADERREWFTDADSLMVENPRDRQAALKGKWVVELPELAGLSKKDAADIKALLAKDADPARKMYGDTQVELPRGCIFVATANAAGGGARLPDLGDNGRRLAPITLHGVPLPAGAQNRNPKTGVGIDIDGLRAERGQILAEALHYVRQLPLNEKTGFPEYTLPDVLKDMRDAQSPFLGEDPLREAVAGVLIRALQAHAADPDRHFHPECYIRPVRGRPAVPSVALRSIVRDVCPNRNTQDLANLIGNIMTDMGCTRARSNSAVYWQLPDDLLATLTADDTRDNDDAGANAGAETAQ